MMPFLIRLFKKKNNNIFEELPDGVCPNCWKDQHYRNIIKKRAKTAEIFPEDKETNYFFIQGYLIRHFDFLKLKNTVNGLECTLCRTFIKSDAYETY
jgi:hypothetical protein